MRYVGIQSQISSNNMKSMLLLVAFPLILLGMTWVFLAIINYFSTGYYDQAGYFVNQLDTDSVNWTFSSIAPFIIGGVVIWFVIAYFCNTKMIQKSTGAVPLMRRENPRVYNIVENLCMTCGMDMPKVNVIDDPQLNAFASGIDKNSYTVTVTTGLLDRLDDRELAGVIGHELTHIRNRDTRLLITSIIFVGIISTVLSPTSSYRSPAMPSPVSVNLWPMPVVPSFVAIRLPLLLPCERSPIIQGLVTLSAKTLPKCISSIPRRWPRD